MATYAEGTRTDSYASKAEIERTLKRWGATQFQYGWDEETRAAIVAFVYNGRRIQFRMALPSMDDPAIVYTPARRRVRSPQQRLDAFEQLTKERWRALALGIKAKLALVEAKITTFEEEFLAHTVLPGGDTVGEWAEPVIQKAYAIGKAPYAVQFPELTTGSS